MAKNNRVIDKPSIASVSHGDALMKFLRSVRNKVNRVAANVSNFADAAATLTEENLGLNVVSNTAAVSLTLPAAADVEGGEFTFVKDTAAAFAVTLVGTINGGANNSSIDAQYDTLTLKSTGAEYVIVASIIAP